jgi:hypothetical protein
MAAISIKAKSRTLRLAKGDGSIYVNWRAIWTPTGVASRSIIGDGSSKSWSLLSTCSQQDDAFADWVRNQELED